MFRFLFIVLALWAAIMIVRHLYRASRAKRDEEPGGVPADTVRCAHCGLHVPKRDAIRDGGRHYCCEAHRREAQE